MTRHNVWWIRISSPKSRFQSEPITMTKTRIHSTIPTEKWKVDEMAMDLTNKRQGASRYDCADSARQLPSQLDDYRPRLWRRILQNIRYKQSEPTFCPSVPVLFCRKERLSWHVKSGWTSAANFLLSLDFYIFFERFGAQQWCTTTDDIIRYGILRTDDHVGWE